MIPAPIVAHLKTRFQFISAQPVGGGCINECYLLKTSEGAFFLKLNSAAAFPDMFGVETKGLKLLASTNALKTPEVYEYGCVNDICFLSMEFIEPGSSNQNTMRNFGQQLAKLHRNTSEQFGLDHDNYIGSIPQSNEQKDSWTEFFIEMRLMPQIKLARNAKLLSPDMVTRFEQLFAKLDSLFPDERPSLLHGDLWSGNYLINTEGLVCLVDPAVYYGHREMDIAMSQLFSGFSFEFYDSYDHHYPLENGWRERISLCNLYPLLVHVNLFGGSYVQQLKSCLEKFV